MNIREFRGSLSLLFFRVTRTLFSFAPGGRISAFGVGDDKIGSIIVINLDRQPKRLQQVKLELNRFRTSDGLRLSSLVRRFSAVDARDGRATAATADVDTYYTIGDQLYVQPDARLEKCFDLSEPVKMTRQETAVARSHIEAWKTIVQGSDRYVLIIEDDVWFKYGAAKIVNRGWQAALQRCSSKGGPKLLYLSYQDAGGTADRADICHLLFRPVRGLWFLSGYVLSREGAAELLRAMPVKGPVDLWINYCFERLGALALTSPVIMQRQDSPSDNSYSILPYLARAGVVDSDLASVIGRTRRNPILAWSAYEATESLAMALSMLGLRVKVFDGTEKYLEEQEIFDGLLDFDVLVDLPCHANTLSNVMLRADIKFIFEGSKISLLNFDIKGLPASQFITITENDWKPICSFLNLAEPVHSYPKGAPRYSRMFRDDRPKLLHLSSQLKQKHHLFDDSPWVMPTEINWQSCTSKDELEPYQKTKQIHESMQTATPVFQRLQETFPGNLASFTSESLLHGPDGAQLSLTKAINGSRPYRSAAFSSTSPFLYGRIEAEIKAARGPGLVTGFFLHRSTPRQEIDIELTGNDLQTMLVNVYFNPGDDESALDFGYRGSPYRIDLGFDASLDFHLYAIDWRPDRIIWLVDNKVVHERPSWNPTPIPHLPMRLYSNLWAPRSKELSGQIIESNLPAKSVFRNIVVQT